jgi:hypothetical protein
MLSQEKKQEIIRILNERIQVLTCPMCHQHSFIIADGYFNNTIQDNLKSINLGGSSIPTIAIVCSHCGFVSQHALGALGLLPSDSNGKQEEKK